MFLHRLTTDVAQEYGLHYYSINDDQYYQTIKQQSWQQFIEKTVENQSELSCFGPIRGGETDAIFPTDLNNYAAVLHLRDPRDVLTSLFFSHSYSHKREEGKFNPSDEKRRRWREAGVDAYALEKMPDYKARYELLIATLLDSGQAKLVKYEDLVTDYPTWLTDFLSAFDVLEVPDKKMLGLLNLPNSPAQIRDRLARKYQREFKIPKSEDLGAHKRQVKPGEHKDKLQPETIATLNQAFGAVLERLGYALT
ncbi:MAG: hypothetical protein ACPGVO_22780 [Spirulinaceae cyanobacterium]